MVARTFALCVGDPGSRLADYCSTTLPCGRSYAHRFNHSMTVYINICRE